MPSYLLFQLYAPLMSWGEAAVGEVRHTSRIPSRSALLGILAAALGIKRDEEQRLNQFNQHYYFAVLPLSEQGQWLRDYHTIQVPRENKKHIYYTRRDELTQAPAEVSTMLSFREYLNDACYLVAVSETPQAPVALVSLAQALSTPVFPLYLGRKSCPLALPLAPKLMDGSLTEVFNKAEQEFREAEQESKQDGNRGLISLLPTNNTTALCYWEGPAEDIELLASHERSDQPLSRKRWQFGTRIQYTGHYGREQ